MNTEHEVALNTPSGKAQLRLSRKGRTFTVLDFEVEGRPELSLAFAPDGPGVENLDEASDVSQCMGRSTCVRYNGVTIGNLEMKANSFEELAYALKHVKIRPFNPEEI